MTGIPNYFATDNFAERRNATESAGVAYDPESLLTGGEEAAGLGYKDRRVWPSKEVFVRAVSGEYTPEQIAAIAPRVKTVSHAA